MCRPKIRGTAKNSTAKNSVQNSINGTTATYTHSTYEFISASLTQSHSQPLVDQERLATVPEGYKVTLMENATISGTIKFSGSVGGTGVTNHYSDGSTEYYISYISEVRT